MTGEGDEKYLFTRTFVLKIVRITHKYHLTIGHLLKKQNEDRRLASLVTKDDIEYSRVFFSKSITSE